MKSKHLWTGLACGAVAGFVSAPEEVAAQQSASAQALLEEVVVTARRREESLEDLPLSIAAINADAMQAQGIYDIKDITEFVPNVAFRDQDRRGRTSIFIRGIGTGGPGTFRPGGAGQYLDGHYIPGNNSSVMSTLDMERIEVLRGPQGTLFGKNTTGGAIQFITAKPQPEFDSSVLLRAADYGQQDFRGMINIPISDTVLSRFAVAKETADGYGYNRNLRKDEGGTDVSAVSAALRFTPNDNWLIDLLFRGNYEDSEQYAQGCTVYPQQSIIDRLIADGQNPVNPLTGQLYQAAPAATAIGQWGGWRGGLGNIERIYRGATLDYWDNCTLNGAAGNFVTSSNSAGYLKQDSEFYNATFEWDSAGEIGSLDNLNVRFIAGRRYLGVGNWADRDQTPLQIDSIGSYIPNANTRVTESMEVLFTADVNDRMTVVAGVHDFWDRAEQGNQHCWKIAQANLEQLSDPDSGFSIPCNFDGGVQFAFLGDKPVGSGGPRTNGRSGALVNSSIAAFGHLTYDLNDDWSIDLGARWTEEDRGFHVTEFPTVANTCVYNPPHFLNNPLLPRAPTEADLEAAGRATSNPGAPPSSEICNPGYLLNFDAMFRNGFYNDITATFSETTPMVSLTRTLAPGDMLDSGIVYGTISQGFLTGAFNDELNVNLNPELTDLLTYEPEHVTNYELGFKGTLADGRLRFATAVFYMDYTNKQEGINIDNSDGRYGSDPQVEIVSNAATVDIYGVELELRAQPWDGGFLSVDVGWLDSQYGEFSSFDVNAPGGTVDRTNTSIEDYSPAWTVTASLEHAFLLGNGATLTPQLGMYFQTDYEFRGGTGSDVTGPASICNQEAFATFRTRVTYEPSDARWQASLFGSNITDKRYYNYCDFARAGVYDYHYGRPDTWGAEFMYRWGG